MAAATTGKLMKPARLLIASVCLCGLAALLAVLASRVEPPPDKRAAFPRGEIAVGVDASFPPFAVDDGQSLTGLDIELAKAIAERIDLPLRFINISYYGLYDALISGEADLLISALRIDPSRMDDLRYTRHYFDNGLLVVSSVDAPKLNAESLAGHRVAFEIGSQAETELRKLEAESFELKLERFPYELPRYALDALRLGIADAAVVDATTLRSYQREYPSWRIERFHLTHDYFAIALSSSRRDAWRLVDDALATLIASGQLATIIDNWILSESALGSLL